MKIYLIESQAQHQSFSLPVLQEQFALEKPQTVKQIGKLLAKGSIAARIDQTSESLVFESQPGTSTGPPKNTDRKEMEHLLSQNLDYIKTMIDSNERSMSLLINQGHYM